MVDFHHFLFELLGNKLLEYNLCTNLQILQQSQFKLKSQIWRTQQVELVLIDIITYFYFFAGHELHFKYRIVTMSDDYKVIKTCHGKVNIYINKSKFLTETVTYIRIY